MLPHSSLSLNRRWSNRESVLLWMVERWSVRVRDREIVFDGGGGGWFAVVCLEEPVGMVWKCFVCRLKMNFWHLKAGDVYS